jgi:predicted HTH domain antitoxin
MYPTEGLTTVLVPKHCKTRSVLIEDAFRALLNLRPWLKAELSIELYLREDVSLLRAAEMADMNIESFKEILKVRGLKVSSYMGSEAEIERGLRLI